MVDDMLSAHFLRHVPGGAPLISLSRISELCCPSSSAPLTLELLRCVIIVPFFCNSKYAIAVFFTLTFHTGLNMKNDHSTVYAFLNLILLQNCGDVN